MKPNIWRFIIGGVILVLGVVALLQSLDVISFSGSLWGIVWALIFIAGGAVFLSVLVSNKANWWAAIPGVILVGLGTVTGLALLVPNLQDEIPGAIFLGSIGIAFLLVYLVARQNWWAIIPAGVMLSLAVTTFVSPFNGQVAGGVFLIGLAITFALLWWIPSIKMTWAWIPALVLAVVGVFVAASGVAWDYIWPAALIIVGVYFIYRAIRSHR